MVPEGRALTQLISSNAKRSDCRRLPANMAPPGLAAEWDNVGLLLGDRAGGAAGHDLLDRAPPESRKRGRGGRGQGPVIVTHHPILSGR